MSSFRTKTVGNQKDRSIAQAEAAQVSNFPAKPEDPEVDAPKLYSIVMVLGTVILGVLLLFFSVAMQIPDEHKKYLFSLFLGNLATTIIVSGGVAVAYEWFMRSKFIQESKRVTQSTVSQVVKHFSERELVDAVENSMARNMPARYRNLVDVGIEDAFLSIDVSRWKDKLSRISKTEIRILKLYISDIGAIEDALVQSLGEKDCTARIILLDPECQDTLEKRASCLPDMTANNIEFEIRKNLLRLKSIYRRLKEENRQDALQVKLHKSFVSVSLQGQGEDFMVGLYLNGRTATQGVQLRVRGPGKELYRQLDKHFENEWTKATPYDLDLKA